jgi:hypothetical protein
VVRLSCPAHVPGVLKLEETNRVLWIEDEAVVVFWQRLPLVGEKFNLNWPIYDGSRLTWCPALGLQCPLSRTVPNDGWHREPFVITSSQ